jgi:hypothetical protein
VKITEESELEELSATLPNLAVQRHCGLLFQWRTCSPTHLVSIRFEGRMYTYAPLPSCRIVSFRV